MRRILVDHARAVRSQKRGGERQRVELEFAPLFSEENLDEMLEMDRALARLEKLDSRQCRIVELRFFVGLSEEEIAETLGISVRTVKRDWRVAKAWLHAELSGAD
jgi:RNA polymerase sigma factor (TIGR02999 family)